MGKRKRRLSTADDGVESDEERAIVLTYRYQARPTAEQNAYLHHCARASTAMFNRIIRERTVETDEGARFTPHGPASGWLTAQKSDFAFWAFDADDVRRRFEYESVANSTLRGANKLVEWSYDSYLGLRKNGHVDARPPSFRNRRRPPMFTHQVQTKSRSGVVSDHIHYSGGRWALVRIPASRRNKIDAWVKIRYHRQVPADAKINQATWKYDRNKRSWFVSLACRLALPEVVNPSASPVAVGVDRGIVVPAACYGIDTATGEVAIDRLIPHMRYCTCGRAPRHAPCRKDRAIREVRLLERSLARKHHLNSPDCFDENGAHKKGPCRWRRSRRARLTEAEIAKRRAKFARCRRELAERISHDLVDGSEDRQRAAGTVVFEDLEVKTMMASARGTTDEPGKNVKAKTGLNRGIASVAWSATRTRTEQKAQRAALDGRTVHVMGISPQNTSRQCPECKHTDEANRKRQAAFLCVACGYRENADRVAARNILTRGLQQEGTTSAPGKAPPVGDGSGPQGPPGERGLGKGDVLAGT